MWITKSSAACQLIPKPRNPNSEPIVQRGFHLSFSDRQIVTSAQMLVDMQAIVKATKMT
jgi:hypothetical protein